MSKVKVSLVHRETIPGTPANYDQKAVDVVYAMVKEALAPLGGIASVVKPGYKVVLKTNACWPVSADSGIPADPRVVEAVCRLIKNETQCDRLTVVERTGIGGNTKLAFEVTGIGAAALRGGADQLLALEDVADVSVRIPHAKVLTEKVHIPKIFFDADAIIYLPKLKTHKGTQMTGCMKLSQGSLPWSDILRCHRADLEQKFVDLLRVLKPHLSIVDALWPMQGQGPGSPYPEDLVKDFNVILAGTDPVACDAVGSAIMGFDDPIFEVGMVRSATAEGLGEGRLENIAVLGKQIADVRRVFRRGTISLYGIHPKIHAHVGGACQGCIHFARTGIDPWLANPERRQKFEQLERLTLIIGYKTCVPDKVLHNPPYSYTFVIGDCTAEHADRGIFLPGCASIGLHMMPFVGMTEEEILNDFNNRVPHGFTP